MMMQDMVTSVAAEPHAAIAGGLAAGIALWTIGARAFIAAMRWLAKKTPTPVDDRVVDKMERVVNWLDAHPEVVDVLHAGINAATGADTKSAPTTKGK